MKAYNLIAKEREMSFGTLSVIALGESGRGRHEALIPCPLGIEDGDKVKLGESKTGKPKILKGDDGLNNVWLARVCTEGSYIRGAFGHVKAPKDSGVEVVVNGYGAYGEAGRIGTWYDYILKVPDNTVIRVKPSRLTPYFLAFGADKVYRLDEEELEIFLDSNDFVASNLEEVKPVRSKY